MARAPDNRWVHRGVGWRRGESWKPGTTWWSRAGKPPPRVTADGVLELSVMTRIFKYTRGFAAGVTGSDGVDPVPASLLPLSRCVWCEMLEETPPGRHEAAVLDHLRVHMRAGKNGRGQRTYPAALLRRALRFARGSPSENMLHLPECGGPGCPRPELHYSPVLLPIAFRAVDFALKELLYAAWGLPAPYWPTRRRERANPASKRLRGDEEGG